MQTKVSDNPIERVLESFDFEKVHAYMILVNWTYGRNENPPTIEELKNTADFLVRQVYASEKEMTTCSTGGFLAEKKYNEIHLSFCLESNFTGLWW